MRALIFFTPKSVGIDPNTVLRDCCLIEIDEDDRDVARGATKVQPGSGRLKYLMTDRYNLVIFDGFPDYGDLFDLQEDPHELNNLWDTEPELRAKLVEKLLFEVVKQQSFYPKKQVMAWALFGIRKMLSLSTRSYSGETLNE
ncbi:MAG: hypothetical protein CMQ15_15090 [Gammaproteobacteria bacterium]|nr:hypothetical protein [Gammaproteobacteria bacterium]